MPDVVIIPTYDRPEMLWLCLEYLAKSPQSSEVQIRVYVDAHIGHSRPNKEEIEMVLGKFPQLSLQVGYRVAHQFPGNSYNLLMAYKDAFETEAEFVFLIEDDVLISPTFFVWHWTQHAIQALSCSIGVQNPGHGAYASLGVCFRRTVLKLLMPHCRAGYFQNVRLYCRSVFPPSPFDCEQDGLIARVLRGHQVQWADDPVAQHVGWYGYHRPRSIRPEGTLIERYEQVKTALSNNGILQSVMRDFGDIQTI
jgi:hypothetical protein